MSEWSDLWLRVKGRFTPKNLLMRAATAVLVFVVIVIFLAVFSQYGW